MSPPGLLLREPVVCDCNILFQALISTQGPAGAILDATHRGRLDLILSQYVIHELIGVASRPHLAARFTITPQRLADFVHALESTATKIHNIPHVFEYPRDPKDAHYVDLAIAARAKIIVSRDADLLSLGDPSTTEGRAFALRLPGLRILTPSELLAHIAAPLQP